MFKRQTVWAPTWIGWGLLALVGLCLALLLFPMLHPFLAVTKPAQGGVMIIEGWLPDYAVEAAYREFQKRSGTWMVAAGGPLMQGREILDYSTTAAVTAATLRRLGCPASQLLVAASEHSYRNRTWQSALAAVRALKDRAIVCDSVTVVSLGAHARRTRLVFQKAFGSHVKVGAISIPSREFEPERWWASSEGLKETLTEAVGWFYERVWDSGRPSPKNAGLGRPPSRPPPAKPPAQLQK